MRFKELTIQCKKEREVLTFRDFNYFHGRMGAGKSTIARLLDFCLGGGLAYTPALQSEFVSASLDLTVGSVDLILTRNSLENQIRAQWCDNDQPFDILVPAKAATGVVLPGTSVENLSDLVFHLAGITPPMVRRSKLNDESPLVRLSLRDMFRYCYLDQESMDSSFFALDDGNYALRQKSLDVLRLVIGFHQQQITELQIALETVREERQRLEAAADAIRSAMTEEQLASPLEIQAEIEKTQHEQRALIQELDAIRAGLSNVRTHASEDLRNLCRQLAKELADIDAAISELETSIQKDKSQRNTLLNLAVRQRRAQSARDVLSGVAFENCPQCGQHLPQRSEDVCSLCGLPHGEVAASFMDDQTIDTDIRARVEELALRTSLQEAALRRLRRQRAELSIEKRDRDQELTKASVEYDSAYLSQNLEMERRGARLSQLAIDLGHLLELVSRIAEMRESANALVGKEAEIREKMKQARQGAEQDTSKLERLKKLFLDCLLRSKLDGFYPDDFIKMESPWFLPEVVGKNTGDFAITSYETLGSGGKKTLFKGCFALAIHLLAREQKASLPNVLIIDSPMKNISERENRAQFVGFNELLYDLAQEELRDTQFIVIDKEFYPPEDGFAPTLLDRYMTPDDPNSPPLIRGYRGK